MDLLTRFKDFFKSDKLDVSARFEMVREAITGTMSKFRAARDLKSGKTIGLKILDAEKTAAFEARFKGLNKPPEGEIACQIKHPRVVETYEHGLTTTGQQYIIMEFIEGQGLNALLQNRDEALVGKRVELVRQMAEGIDAVHKAGFIHRDICPRNFICAPDLGSLKLIDFGLAVPNIKEYKQPGNRTGTPLYMAPEVVRRRATDERLDLFSFGVTAYRTLTFEMPWGSTSDTTGKAALAHDTNPPTSIFKHRPNLNKALGEAVMRCLEANPQNRPDSAEHFLSLIRNVKAEED